MADAKEPNRDEAEVPVEPRRRKSKKGLFMGGGILALIAAAYGVSLVALPRAPRDVPFKGPWVAALSAKEVQVNLKGESSKRYMVVSLQAEYDAYEESYAAARVADPLYQAKLVDTLITLGRLKTREDLDDQVGQETFKEEVREAVDPLVFPVHVGNPKDSTLPDEKSGLVAGRSTDLATMRGGFYSHRLHVDGPRRTIALDNGQAVTFQGSETDLEVENEHGQTVYVDVTSYEHDFTGEVPIGTFGRIRAVLFSKFLVQ